jgi:uncharacterized protein YprB with RNaseH-like and TPR domain
MKKPKILYFDIETSSIIGDSWRHYDTHLHHMRRYSGILSFAYKWKGSKQVHCETREHQSEKVLLVKLRNLFNKADIVIAHNGKAFDVKKSRAFFLLKALKPHTPFATIDTRTEAKKWFSLDSNSLDNIADMLGVGRKLPHPGYSMWLGCERGDKDSWKLMRKYNQHDVVLLEGVFNKMKPWIIAAPQLTVKQALKPYGLSLKDVL